jgi:hypothetical protein
MANISFQSDSLLSRLKLSVGPMTNIKRLKKIDDVVAVVL